MVFRDFTNFAKMEQKAVGLLGRHLCMSCNGLHAVMLTGGKTPLGLYRRLEQKPVPVDNGLHLLISDERHVPLDSSESNFGRIRGMINALGLDDSRVMRIHTELSLEESANLYNEELENFLGNGGRVTLGFLGLGIDGHVASLFSYSDLERGKGRYAVAVPREDGPDRVSVTRDFLLRTEQIVFLVAGAQKAEVVEKMRADPETLIAAQALENASNIELWYSSEL